MADNVTVSNAPTSVNADIPVRSLDKSGEQTQVVAIDFGGGGAENLTVPNFATQTTLAAIDTKLGGTISTTLPTSTGTAPAFATIGLTSVSIGLGAGTYQKLAFCNTSVGTISLSFNGAAVANRGIVLNRGEKVFIDGPIVVTTINAISNSVGSNLAIQAFT